MQRTPHMTEAPAVSAFSDLMQPPGSRTHQIVELILNAAQLLRGLLADHFAKLGLNDVRYAVLKCISRSGPGGCSQAELAAQLQLSESNVSGLVERMRIGGYVYRLRSKRDRRKRVLLLTEQGQQSLKRVDRCHVDLLSKLLHGLDPFQKRLLAELLSQAVEDLRAFRSSRRGLGAASCELAASDRGGALAPSRQRAQKDIGK